MGGIFFKATDKAKLKEWYRIHLEFNITEWGYTFQWIDPNDPTAKVPARTEWSPFPADTKYFQPSQKEFMFNYRVKDLVTLLSSSLPAAKTVWIYGILSERVSIRLSHHLSEQILVQIDDAG